MSGPNRKRKRPVYSISEPPRLMEEVRRMARAHRQPISREIEQVIEARVHQNSRKS